MIASRFLLARRPGVTALARHVVRPFAAMPRVPPPAAASAQPKGLVDAYGNAIKPGAAASSAARTAAKAPPKKRDPPGPLVSPNGALIVDVTAANFKQVVLECPVPVILQFTASWCEPCKQLSPILESIVQRGGGRLRLARVDVDAEPRVAQAMQVRSVPTVFGVAGGEPVSSFQGLPSQEVITEFFQKLQAGAAAAGLAETARLSGDPLTAVMTRLGEASAAVDEGDAQWALQAVPPALQTLQQMFTAIKAQLEKQARDAAGPDAGDKPPVVRTDSGPLADVELLTGRALSVMVRALIAEAQRGLALAAAAAASGSSGSSAASGGAGGDSDAAPEPLLSPNDCFEQAQAYGAELASPRFKLFANDDVVARGISAAALAKGAREGE